MIRIQASVSKGWLHKKGKFSFDAKYYSEPFYRMVQDQQCNEFIKKYFPNLPIYNMEDNLVQAEFVAPNQMLVGAIQPNMIIAAALGSEFSFSPDKDSDVKGRPFENLTDLKDLPAPSSLLESGFIKDLDIAFDNAKKKYHQCRVIPAFFWDLSGRGTIHGLITTAQKLVGEDVFIKMMSEPEFMLGLHQWIIDVYTLLLNHFSRKGGLRINMVHVGECSGTMLSADLYEQFITPFIGQLGKSFGGIRLHSCGNADHVIDSICKIENLKSIDVGSGTNIAAIRQRMGKDFEISTFPPVDVLTLGAPISKMQQWLDNVIKENQDGKLKISYHLEPEYDERICMYIHGMLETMGIKNQRVY